MEKKIMLLLLILFLIPFTFADDINNYSVKDPVPLGQNATAYGLFIDDANISGNVLCAFYLLDENLVLVNRADDQYTDSLGYFMSRFPINEPDFKRDSSYTIRTVCGGATTDKNFTVIQRENLSFYGQQEFDYLTTPGNTDTVFIWGVFILILVILIIAGLKLYNLARGK